MPPTANPGVPVNQPTASHVQPVVQVPGQQVYYHPVMRSTKMMARQAVVYLPQVTGAAPPAQPAVVQAQGAAVLPRSMDAVDIRTLNYSTNAQGPIGAYHRTQQTSTGVRSGRWIFVDDQPSGATAPSTAVQSAG